jgi:hypothetical protein
MIKASGGVPTTGAAHHHQINLISCIALVPVLYCTTILLARQRYHHDQLFPPPIIGTTCKRSTNRTPAVSWHRFG